MEEEISFEEINIGDVVVIKSLKDLAPRLEEYSGKTGTITSAGIGYFKLDIDDNCNKWDREFIETVNGKKIKEKFDDRERVDFERGDLVKIRTLESMKSNYYYEGNEIFCHYTFSDSMGVLENEKAVIRNIRGKDVCLLFQNKELNKLDFGFSTDMIELVEKNHIKERTKGVKKEKMENENDEIIKEMIAKVDLKKVKKILSSSFQIPATKLLGVGKMLEDWAKAKREIYLIFGKELRISKEIEYEAGECEWKEKIRGLCLKYPGTKFMLDNFSWRCFARNEYSQFSSYFEEEFMPDSKEGMKLSTFLSRAFKNHDFDVDLSKVIDETKIKGMVTISIDPIDYLLMSVNKSGWQSCHSIHEGRGRNFGCYVGRNI